MHLVWSRCHVFYGKSGKAILTSLSHILGLEWAMSTKFAPIWIFWLEEIIWTPNVLHLYGFNFGWKSLPEDSDFLPTWFVMMLHAFHRVETPRVPWNSTKCMPNLADSAIIALAPCGRNDEIQWTLVPIWKNPMVPKSHDALWFLINQSLAA